MTIDKPDMLLWMDVETTGLDPDRDRILEVEMRCTDMRGVRCVGDWFATLFTTTALLLVPHAIIRPIIGIGLHHWIPIQWLALHAMLIILTLCIALAAYIIADRTAPEPPETY